MNQAETAITIAIKGNTMTQKIAILPGDGIGPEIIAEAVKVLHALNLDLQLETAPSAAQATKPLATPCPPPH